jgi:CheY-like chemotaxis protein
MKLLIVDDNARVRRLIAGVVAPLLAEVVECEDGADAIRSYRSHRPDVVLMDVEMRDMDGIAATTAILDVDPTARVIIVTDYDEADLREAAVTAGACGYVSKENLLALRDLLEGMRRQL